MAIAALPPEDITLSRDDRVSIGVPGVDHLLDGGLPRGFVLCVMGSFGTGKTTLGMQFLADGLSQGEKCIFVTLEEEPEAIVAAADSWGHDFASAIREKRLMIVKLSPVDARSTLRRINSELLRFIRESGAKRVVLDSATLLSSVFETDVDRRAVLFEVANAVRAAGATGILTAELARAHDRFASRDGLVEYVADGVMALRYGSGEAPGSTIHLEMTILKMRRTRHSRRVVQYEITDGGLTLLDSG